MFKLKSELKHTVQTHELPELTTDSVAAADTFVVVAAAVDGTFADVVDIVVAAAAACTVVSAVVLVHILVSSFLQARATVDMSSQCSQNTVAVQEMKISKVQTHFHLITVERQYRRDYDSQNIQIPVECANEYMAQVISSHSK